jgi:hypothetical protein
MVDLLVEVAVQLARSEGSSASLALFGACRYLDQ